MRIYNLTCNYYLPTYGIYWSKVVKSEKNGILDFLTNSNTYLVYGKLFVPQKKIVKQKMQGAKSFVAPIGGKYSNYE